MHMLTVQCEDETSQLKLINCKFCRKVDLRVKVEHHVQQTCTDTNGDMPRVPD